ncbi:MAG: zinc carboxypeptidase, partial [Bacteroidia bacterium]|nr:zinc carboxypeptidase [Bacteroidia bacterium]
LTRRRDRYANYYNQYGNAMYNASPDAKEHREPWPGGRANHYWFDLNRDWAWLQQQESQQRIAVYNQWLPHVHVDFHEQGHNSPYYFAPAAEPLHEMISDWQRQFQVTIGKTTRNISTHKDGCISPKMSFDLY